VIGLATFLKYHHLYEVLSLFCLRISFYLLSLAVISDCCPLVTDVIYIFLYVASEQCSNFLSQASVNVDTEIFPAKAVYSLAAHLVIYKGI